MKTIQDNFSSPIKENQNLNSGNVPSFLMTPTKSEFKNTNQTPVRNRRGQPSAHRIEKLTRAPIKGNINGHNYNFIKNNAINGHNGCLRF